MTDDELVLVIPRSAIMSDPGWYGVRTDGLELFAARNRLFEPRGIEKCVPHGLTGRGDLVRAFELHAATLLLAGLTDAGSNRTTGMRVAAYRDGRNHTPQGGS